MRARSLALIAVTAVALAAGAWWALQRRDVAPSAIGAPLLPQLAERRDGIDTIALYGAGDRRLLELRKVDGRWVMPDRGDWPANQRQIGEALRVLAEARGLEAKTADPARHVRLGVETIAGGAAKGVELRLSGGGEPLRLTVGDNHPSLGGSYVRIGDQAQVWLADGDLSPAREPVLWLDRRLLDIPVIRIERVRLAPAQGRAFVLARADDRFSLDGQPPAALADPDAGVATAGFTDQLALDDVAADGGSAATTTAVFASLDGITLTVQAWQDERGTWARLQPELDAARARAWYEQAAADAAAAAIDVDTRVAELQAQVEQWRQRFRDRQFLLPDYKAALLLKDRDAYFADAP